MVWLKLVGLHRRLATVHEQRKTPITTIMIVVAVASLLAVFLDIKVLASMASYLILLIFVLVHGSLIIIKLRKSHNQQPHFVTPLIVPILGLVSSICLLGFQTITVLNLL